MNEMIFTGSSVIRTDRNENVIECSTMPNDDVCKKCGYNQKCLNWLAYFYKTMEVRKMPGFDTMEELMKAKPITPNVPQAQPLSPELAEKINEIKAAISGVKHDSKQDSAEIKRTLGNLSTKVAQLGDVISQFQSIFTKPIDLSWALQMFMAMMEGQETSSSISDFPIRKNTSEAKAQPPKTQNTMIFIDGQNLRGAFMKDYKEKDHRVGPEDAVSIIERDLRQLFSDSDVKIHRVHYFDEANEIKDRRFLKALQYHSLMTTHPITEYIGEDGEPTSNIDPYLIDYIRGLLNDGFRLDIIVLVTGDGGKDTFLKLVCELQTKGIKVIVAYPKKCGGLSANLERQANHFIDLSELSIM